jgi:purine-binding chemotaxis protein CheW
VKFGLNPISYSIDTSIIVIEIEVEGELIQIGTLVDSVLEVLEIPESSIQPSPSIEAKYNLDFIKGMFQKEDDFVMLLDLSEVFSIDDVSYMQKTNTEKSEK